MYISRWGVKRCEQALVVINAGYWCVHVLPETQNILPIGLLHSPGTTLIFPVRRCFRNTDPGLMVPSSAKVSSSAPLTGIISGGSLLCYATGQQCSVTE